MQESWERLTNTLRQLPKKHLDPMNIFDLPRQLQNGPGMNLGAMEEYADSEPPDLLGERHAPIVMERGTFSVMYGFKDTSAEDAEWLVQTCWTGQDSGAGLGCASMATVCAATEGGGGTYKLSLLLSVMLKLLSQSQPRRRQTALQVLRVFCGQS